MLENEVFLLGDYECDEETAYYMKYGKYPPRKECNCKSTIEPEIYDREWEQEQYYDWIEANDMNYF